VGVAVVAGAASSRGEDGGAAARPSVAPRTLVLSPQGSDSNPCTPSAPCRSLDRGYHAARPGDIVELAAGAYAAGQEINADPTKTSSRHVVFRPARGARVSIARTRGFASLDLRGVSHLTLLNLNVTGDLGITPSDSGPRRRPSDIRILGGRLATLHVFSVRGLTIRRADIGNYSYRDNAGSTWFSSSPGYPPAQDVLIDRVLWRNIHRDDSPTHAECAIFDAVDGLVVRRSRFVACPVMALFFSGDKGAVASNVLVENNFISCGGGPTSEGCGATINFRPDFPFRNVTIRFNSISGLLYLQPGTYSGFRVYGNVVGGISACPRGANFAYNVSENRTCSPTDRSAPAGWMNEGATDLRLRPGAAAVGLVPPGYCASVRCPAVDLFGHRRTRPLDAGAHEQR
jgi:hypothetical protein